MRMRVVLLVWPGLVLAWLGGLVFGWGNVESGTADSLVQLSSGSDLIPPADPVFGEPLGYVTSGHLLALTAVTAAAVLLPLAGGRLRHLAGIISLAAGAALAYVTYSGNVAGTSWSPTVTYIVAGALAVAALCYFTGRPGPVGILAGVLALAAAVWNTNAAVQLLLPEGRPGLGAIALTVGFLLVAAGAFTATGQRRPRHG